MESNTPEINPLQDDVQNAIESLRSTLNNNYLTAEKLMSLRNPEIKSLNESVAKVEDSYNELMKIMSSNMTPARTIADVATNKREFDERISDWFTRTGTMGSNKDFARFYAAPTSSTKSSKSSRSSSLTVRRLQATLNLKTAQLQANHMRERAEEQQRKLQLDAEEQKRKLQLDAEEQQRKSRLETELEEREALREIALAELECKVWEEAESKDVKGPSFSNPNPSTLLTPSSVGTQFPTASMATKRVTFGQTAVSTANTSRSGYEANSGATPLNEGASRPSLDALQHLPTRSYSPFTNTPYQPWLYNVDYDSMFLPRPEFPKFKGDPLEFKSFLNNFETHLEPRVHDERTLFCLLLQHCSEDIQGQINHLAGQEACYQRAKQKLVREYGSPWIISDACYQKLKEFPAIKSGASRQLKTFCELLEKTLEITKDISRYTNLDTLDTLTALVGKFPYNLRGRWVKRSVEIEKTRGFVAEFSDLVEFVKQESDVANSLFGLRTLNDKSNPKSKPSSSKATVAFLEEENKRTGLGSCWYCKDTRHKLLNCASFLNLSLNERCKFVKTTKLCHKCLSSKHRTPACKRTNTCKVDGCSGAFHHTLLHRSVDSKKLNTCEKSTSTSDAIENTNVSSALLSNKIRAESSSGTVYLSVVPVRVAHKNKSILTYAFLDQGSTHTFCDENLVKTLNLNGPETSIQIKTINGSSKVYKSILCDLEVSALNNDNSFSLTNVHSIESISLQPNSIPPKRELSQFQHLKDIRFDTIPGASIQMLIGADVPEMFCVGNIRKGPKGTPYAIETPLGWSLLGPSMTLSSQSNFNVNFLSCKDNELLQATERLWKSDFERGTSVLNVPNSKEDRAAYDVMETRLCLDGGHYQLPLLWKDECQKQLPDNLPLARKRLFHLRNRFLKDEKLRKAYTEAIESYLSEGYAQEITEKDIQNASTVWYIPHHPVVNPSKPGKLRVVFDCAAKFNGTSLNDKLMKGPDLANSLVGVLTRFRKNKVALVADVKAMFHQIKVDPRDQNALRFLWWNKGDLYKELKVYKMVVHPFGATSSPSCANFCLKQTAREFGHLYPSMISGAVLHNFYVDDCLVSVPTVKEAVTMQQKLTELLARRGFHLRKWISNDDKVLESISELERSNLGQFMLDNGVKEKVLGIQWHVKGDYFTFDIHVNKKSFTRRGLLFMTASVYDPMGFVAPVILEAKLLLQDLCKQKANWDSVISEEERVRWSLWLEELPYLSELRIPRCFTQVAAASYEIFSDNGTNFVGAERVLRESLQSLQQSKLNNFCLQLEIKWRFNPPYASHMGGAWERMIRSVRRILNALTQMQTLTEECLVTLMTEVEGILNSRPLVPLTLHDSEEEPLTPNHLLLLRGNPNLPPGTFDTNSCYTRRRWAQVQFLANQFWRRWAKEFLPNLLQRQKWFNRNRNFEVGDVVLLVEDMQHSNTTSLLVRKWK